MFPLRKCLLIKNLLREYLQYRRSRLPYCGKYTTLAQTSQRTGQSVSSVGSSSALQWKYDWVMSHCLHCKINAHRKRKGSFTQQVHGFTLTCKPKAELIFVQACSHLDICPCICNQSYRGFLVITLFIMLVFFLLPFIMDTTYKTTLC